MKTDIFKHVAAGIAGGIAGTFAMQYYWKTATAVAGKDPRSLTAEGAPKTLDEMSVVGRQYKEGESSTMVVGRKLYTALTAEEPSSKEKSTMSQAVHWVYGGVMGGAYGALRGPRHGADLSGGAAFGTALWALGDELMVPLLGLAKGPTAYPLEQHLHRLGAHVAYGGGAALVTQALLHPDTGSSLREWVWSLAKTYAEWKALKALGQGLWNVLRDHRS